MRLNDAYRAGQSYLQVRERLRSHDDIYCIDGDGLEIYLQRDFLSAQECAAFIALIEGNNRPSTVMGGDIPDQDYRTSNSAPLAHSRDPLIDLLDERIAAFTGIGLKFQEFVEGQRYLVGQQFKPHFDAFLPDTPFLEKEQASGGQRTWTVMICLNEPGAGGGTAFPTAGVRLRPRAGNLIAWCSLDAGGAVNPASLHCGEPVLAGSKYILTKWHRERPFLPRVRDAPGLRQVPRSRQLAQAEAT